MQPFIRLAIDIRCTNVIKQWYVMKKRFTEDGWRKDPWFRALALALKACKTEDEVADFLRDVGTLSELQAWSERLEVAKQLSRGLSYRQVAENTGASTTTVTRVAKFIENGEGGYRKYLKTQKKERELSPTEKLKERTAQHHEHSSSIGGERRGSMLKKYL